MKRKIITLCVIVFMISCYTIWLSHINSGEVQLKKHASHLQLEEAYRIVDYEYKVAWFGEKSEYFLIEYPEADMARQMDYLMNKLQKVDPITDLSFQGLFQDDFGHNEVYQRAIQQESNSLLYHHDVKNETYYFVYAINKNQMAIFVSIG